MSIYKTIKSIFGGKVAIYFDEVATEEFTRVEGSLPTYLQIESALCGIGGGSWIGFGFKESVLKNAGWPDGSDTPFYANATQAAAVFNRIRGVLAETSNPTEILEKLA